MFCSKCGKQLADTSAFCTFCGSPTALPAAAVTPVSEPVQPVQTVQSVPVAAPLVSEPVQAVQPVSAAVLPVSEPTSIVPPVSASSEITPPVNGDTPVNTASIPEESGVSEPLQERISAPISPAFPGESELPREPLAGFPAPVDPPKTGVSGSFPSAPITPSAPTAALDLGAGFAAAVPEQAKEQKYYTFGHIALCLAAVAVMAIVAGVFAGLYFSTF